MDKYLYRVELRDTGTQYKCKTFKQKILYMDLDNIHIQIVEGLNTIIPYCSVGLGQIMSDDDDITSSCFSRLLDVGDIPKAKASLVRAVESKYKDERRNIDNQMGKLVTCIDLDTQ